MNRIQKQKIQLVMTCTSLNDHIASWWYVLICQKKKTKAGASTHALVFPHNMLLHS